MKKTTFLKSLLVAVGLCAGVNSWAEDVIIFSMTTVTGPTTAITHGADPTAVQATFNTGSSATVYNGHSTNDNTMCDGRINLAGSGNSYFHATFTTALAEGDIITSSVEASPFYVSYQNSSYESISFPYTIPEGSSFIGKTDVYVKKNNDGGKEFSSFTITRPVGVRAPSITLNGSEVTLECKTDGASIYYTTDGTSPTSSSSLYSSVFTLENSCTVRAIAIKDTEESDITEKDCFIDHSADAVKVLFYTGGVLDSDSKIWTSTDDDYVMTISTNTFGWVTLNNVQDGFKLNHVDSYELTTPANLKISKIKVVGKTWSKGNTATMAIDGFTTNDNSFITYPSDGTAYLKTLEFTPSSDLGYGATITFRPAGTQLGAYIELYGSITNDPAEPIKPGSVTQTVLFNGDGAVCTNSDVITMTGGGLKNPTYSGYTKAMELSSNAVISINLPSGSSNASVELFGTNLSTKLKINSDNTKSDVTWVGDADNGYTTTIIIDDSNAGKLFTIKKGDGASQIHKITLTYNIGNENEIQLTTTSNMAGWRSFYDADNGYTVDENTTVYIATAKTTEKVTLKAIDDIPAGTPVILKTSSSADNYKMTLTKAASTTSSTTGNLLQATTAGQNLSTAVYRLGYGSNGVSFYPYSTSSAAAGIVYISASAGEGTRSLIISIGDDLTGISESVSETISANHYFNLQGQKVKAPKKGLYIANGKKIIMK